MIMLQQESSKYHVEVCIFIKLLFDTTLHIAHYCHHFELYSSITTFPLDVNEPSTIRNITLLNG